MTESAPEPVTESAGQDQDHTRNLAADILSQSLGDAMRDQRLRQERLRHVQEFLSSPAFLDLRDAPITVSDDAAALAEHRRDLTYRIEVLQSMLALLSEERDLLDRARPAGTPDADPDPDPETSDLAALVQF